MSTDRKHANDAQTQATPVCLWMPGLYGTGKTPGSLDRAMPGIARLWPGLPERALEGAVSAAGRLTPDDLPCLVAEMGAWLRDTEAFLAESARDGSAAAEAVIRERARAERGRLRAELDAVAALMGGSAELAARTDALRRQERAAAQRELAWIWRQQRALVDIDELVASVNAASERLGAGMGADMNESLEAVAKEFAVPLAGTSPEPAGGTHVAVSGADDLAPDWRVVLAAAMTLLPPEIVYVAEGGMAADVRAMASFSPAPALCAALGLVEGAMLLAEIPAQELLGRLAPREAGLVRIALPAEELS